MRSLFILVVLITLVAIGCEESEESPMAPTSPTPTVTQLPSPTATQQPTETPVMPTPVETSNPISTYSSAPAAIAAQLSKNVVATKYAGNPILELEAIPWADHYAEHPQILKDGSTYHMYFHAADVVSYKIGHATAPAITGPWTADALPILTVGAPGSWDHGYVATAYVMKVGTSYYMWYSGYDGVSSIELGLATATSPGGPFTKYVSNPLPGPASWVGSVQLVGGVYYMLGGAENAQDMWTSAAPEGPWAWQSRPFGPGLPGAWNSVGSMGESGLTYIDGIWYMFFGGRNADPDPPDLANARPYNIGLAYSLDTVTWYEYPDNPIIPHGGPGDWDEFRLSEIGTYYENGTFYVVYTGIGKKPGWAVWSDLGVTTVTFSND